MLVLANISGIQDYLFDVRESGGGQAKSLRFRSLRIQLIAEIIAARMMSRVSSLPGAGLVFCAAGKVAVNAPGADHALRVALEDEIEDIRKRLLDETHGRLRVALAFSSAGGNAAELYRRGMIALAREKLRAWAPRENHRWSPRELVTSEPFSMDVEAERDKKWGGRLSGVDDLLEIRRAPTEAPVSETILGMTLKATTSTPREGAGIMAVFELSRLARHVPRDANGNPEEFMELARRARGAPMLGVLKADADSLGQAVEKTLVGDGGLEKLKLFSESINDFFSVTLEKEKTSSDSPWRDVYTVFSGGDDMLAVGPWNVMLDYAGHVRRLFNKRFGAGAKGSHSATPLTISASVALIKPMYPIHLAARQADELLERAKTQPAPRAVQSKDQCAALGEIWKWEDHGAIIGAGKQLAEWTDDGVIQRGWLHTLLRLSLLRRGRAGPEFAGIHPAVATSRLAYHVARMWPRKQDRPRDDHQRAASDARAWIDAVLREFDQFDATTHTGTLHLPAIVRYALLATRAD